MFNIKYGAPLFNVVVILAFFFVYLATRGINGMAESRFEDEIASVFGLLLVPLIISVIVTGVAGLIKGNVSNRGGYFVTTFMIMAALTIVAQIT